MIYLPSLDIKVPPSHKTLCLKALKLIKRQGEGLNRRSKVKQFKRSGNFVNKAADFNRSVDR